MGLQLPAPPANGSSLVLGVLTNLAAGPLPPPSVRNGGTNLQTQAPHTIYDFGAGDVVAGRGLDAAQRTAFRYPVVDASGVPVAAAEATTDPQGKANRVTFINYGPFVAATDLALAELGSKLGTSPVTYEVRALRSRGLSVMAIWLHAPDPAEDLIYPMAPAPAPLVPQRLYTPGDFFAAILPLAQARVAARSPGLVP